MRRLHGISRRDGGDQLLMAGVQPARLRDLREPQHGDRVTTIRRVVKRRASTVLGHLAMKIAVQQRILPGGELRVVQFLRERAETLQFEGGAISATRMATCVSSASQTTK